MLFRKMEVNIKIISLKDKMIAFGDRKMGEQSVRLCYFSQQTLYNCIILDQGLANLFCKGLGS